MRAQTPPPVRRLLDALPGAGPRVDDAVRTATDVTAAGAPAALEHPPAPGGTGTAAVAPVRCPDVPVSGPGHPGVGSTDPRPVAITAGRAAGNERASDSREYVMPWQVRREQQRRPVAGGYRVRVALRPGRVVPPATVQRRPAGRS